MFTNRGDIVLDPMNGSGTSTLEAYLLERDGIGYDIDPLAVKLAKVKTTPLTINQEELLSYIMNKANDYIQSEELVKEYLEERFDRKTKEFIDYWFFPKRQKELVSLILAIEDMPQTDPVRDFLEIIFSSIIITKSGGVSRARDSCTYTASCRQKQTL